MVSTSGTKLSVLEGITGLLSFELMGIVGINFVLLDATSDDTS